MDAKQLIIAVMADVQGVAKRDKNTAQGFNFRGIDAVLNAVGPSIRKHGGFIVPTIMKYDASMGQTAKGAPINIVRLEVAYSVSGSEGEPVTGTVVAEAFDSGDKATAKAMSVALRTFLLQLLALPTDEPDADSYSYEATAVVSPKPVPARAWLVDVDKLSSTDGARRLYLDAQKAKAGQEVLDAITAKAKTLG